MFNEVGSLPDLHTAIGQACEAVGRGYEIIYIDDGSDDGSAARLDEFAATDPHTRVVHFRRNFGKSPALAAGFERVVGEIVITLDADLQDDPDMIPRFVARIDAGADLVCGWKQKRHDPLGKTVPSRIFNACVRRISGIPLRDFNCGFKAYRIECARELSVYGGLHRFMPLLAGSAGFRIEQIVVEHRPRKYGASKFGAGRFIEGFMDLLTVILVTRFRTQPLHFFGPPGLLVGGGGVAILGYLAVLWCSGEAIGGRPLLILGVLMTLISAVLVCIGLLGELLVRTTISPREVYSIRSPRRTGLGSPPGDLGLADSNAVVEVVKAASPRLPPQAGSDEA